MVTLFVLGILVALLLEETTGLSPGGVVTVPFLAMLMSEPGTLALQLAVALLAWAAVRGAGRVMIVYGRRRLAIAIVASVGLSLLLRRWFPIEATALGAGAMLGFIVPGVMADWFERQGALPTMVTLAAALGIVALGGVAFL
jgi:poly-gamma-glutamate biosynthesis protein PgsC/CapC